MTLHPAVRRTALTLAVACAATAAAAPAQAQTGPTSVNTVVVRMSGEMTLKLDKKFLATIKKSKAKVVVRGGAKYSSKRRTATMPVGSSTTITIAPPTADILATGSLLFRRSDGRKIAVQDIALRIREAGADLSSTLRGRPQRQFAGLSVSPTTNVQQSAGGYDFVDLLMVVSEDLAAAAKKAKIRGVVAGDVLGLVTAKVTADLPSLELPGIGLPGLGGVIGAIPGLGGGGIPGVPTT